MYDADGRKTRSVYKKRRLSGIGRQGHCLNLLIIKYQLTVKNRKTAFQPTLSTINNQFLQF